MSFRIVKDFEGDRVDVKDINDENLNVTGLYRGPPNRTAVFRPGYTGPPLSGVFASWAEAVEYVSEVYGPKFIVMDATSGPLVIPPGAWNMTDITLGSLFSSLQLPTLIKTVIIQEGATLNGLSGTAGPMSFVYEGTTGPCIIMNSTLTPSKAGFSLGTGTTLSCTGTQPFISIQGSDPNQIIMGPGSGILISPVPVVSCAAGAQMFIIGLGNISRIEDNVLASDVGSFTLILIASNSFNMDFNYTTSQPALLGFVQLLNLVRNSPFIYRKTVAPGASDDENAGYKSGDIWIDTTTNDVYICASAAAGAAIWKLV